MSYPCHIFFSKKIYLDMMVYPKLKKLHLVYTWYIFSCHMPCLSMPYPCHKFVRLSGAGPANEIRQEIALRFEFCTPQHSVHQAQQDLFDTAARADSSLAPGLGWGRRRRGLLRAGGPRRRGGSRRGGRRRGGRHVSGVRRWGVRRRIMAVGLLGSVR